MNKAFAEHNKDLTKQYGNNETWSFGARGIVHAPDSIINEANARFGVYHNCVGPVAEAGAGMTPMAFVTSVLVFFIVVLCVYAETQQVFFQVCLFFTQRDVHTFDRPAPSTGRKKQRPDGVEGDVSEYSSMARGSMARALGGAMVTLTCGFRCVTIQISRRYHIHPQLILLTKHV